MVSNPARSKGTGDRKRLRAVRDPISWLDIDPKAVIHFIGEFTNDGAAVILGRTRDMGSLSVCVLMGDTKEKEYFSNAREAVVVMDDILDDFGLAVYDVNREAE